MHGGDSMRREADASTDEQSDVARMIAAAS